MVKTVMELASIVFLLYLGIRFVRVETIPMCVCVEGRIEEKIHPHSAFVIGIVRVMCNPGVLLYWILLATQFVNREWVQQTLISKFSCVAGVAGGTFAWFASLGVAVSCRNKKFSQKTLLRMERFSGWSLIALALADIVQVIWHWVQKA